MESKNEQSITHQEESALVAKPLAHPMPVSTTPNSIVDSGPYPVSQTGYQSPSFPYNAPQNAYPPTVYPSTGYPYPAAPKDYSSTQNNVSPPLAPPPSYDESVPQSQISYQPNVTQTTNTTVIFAGDNFSDEIGFNSKTVRLGFIRKVFAILSIQLAVTVGVICLFLFVDSVKNAGQNVYVYVTAYILFFVLYFVLVCCDSVRRNYPSNMVLLSIFTLCLSYLVGVISSYHDTKLVLIMMAVTALVTICVSLFACQTKFDMTKYGGVLCVCALVLFFVLVFSPVFLLVTSVGRIAIGGVMALLFTAFLVYDVQLVMGGRKYELSEEEYVFGALILYVDIVNILLILLYLFGGSNN